ncbi:MAG: CDP-diacylglycerol--serine O-phosphatidyltransferase [Bacteroidales bacterium]
MIRKAIPSIITLGNLLCGFLAISADNPTTAFLLIFLGATLDMFDGLAAKLLKATSLFGKQLDSLADMVTFGVAPAIAVYHLMEPELSSMLIVAMIPIFSAIRLAWFNILVPDKPGFKGLPTPANGIFFAALPLLATLDDSKLPLRETLFANLPVEQIWLPVTICIFALLMVAPIRMFPLKAILEKGVEQYFVAALFVLVFPTFLTFGWQVAAPAGVVFYILLSVVYHLYQHIKTTGTQPDINPG